MKNSVVSKIKKGFYVACEDLKAPHLYVAYGGNDEFPIEKETVVISLKNIMMKMQGVNNDSS